MSIPKYYIHEYYLIHICIAVFGLGLYYKAVMWGMQYFFTEEIALAFSLKIIALVVGLILLGWLNAKRAATHKVKVEILHIFLTLLLLFGSMYLLQDDYWRIILESILFGVFLQSGSVIYNKTKLKQ